MLYILMLCFICIQGFAEGIRKPPEKAEYTPQQIAGSQKIKHLIILFQENWSFDGLYGKFPGVDGIENASEVSKTQIDLHGKPYPVLPPCLHGGRPYPQIPRHLKNGPFDLEPYIPMSKGTGDLVHAFHNEKEQINGGLMNAFVSWGNTAGFAMSYYDISNTRIGKIARQFTICDRFFHSCYGASTPNVIWLFAAQMPHVSADDYSLHDTQPFYPPHKSHGDRLPPQNYKTIGDLLSEKGIGWGWYAEGWTDALLGIADGFPYHHQAPTYFSQYAPGTAARTEHLFDLNQFYEQLDRGAIPSVCFIRTLEKHSDHPGEGPLLHGLNFEADFVERVQKSPIWKDCAIILTYDENGGRWDHVAPPIVDQFGPATRIPCVIISPFAKRGFVDHTSYETVSILKFIEQRWGLPPLSKRDAEANNLLNSFDFTQ